MIAPAGIVQRIARIPCLHLEFIATKDGNTWTEERDRAFVFSEYGNAKKLAQDLGGIPIMAVRVHKSVNVEEQPSSLFPDVVDPLLRRRAHSVRARTLQLTGTQA